MSTALIKPSLLIWSRQRANLTQQQVADTLAVKLAKIIAWEAGEEQPTFKQAQKWANATHVPFGYLFLSSPPQDEIAIPDLRTVGGAVLDKPSPALQEMVKDALKKQDWFKEYLIDQGAEPLPFIGKFSHTARMADVVADMRMVLGFADPQQHPNHDDYLRKIIANAEVAGILVMRSGIVGANTHRKLDVAEFRGFAISDPIAPIVFINSADAPSARLFTLIHELAHLWIGSSGISNFSRNVDRKEEAFCNQVAGEFLVPETEIKHFWNDELVLWTDNLAGLASRFKVSKLVVAKRAADLGFISDNEYATYYRNELELHRQSKSKDSGGSGDFYANLGARNGKRLSQAVVAAALSGQMLLRDAASLLGVQPSKITTFAGKLNI
ncbi:XRE family transcriptional regulator [Deefgea rivuli]|uniref:XRE family transcriptional regulator n=1 Tax=Deefgea rivuli TaxID=400948 RepID=UPI00056934FB|nr:XRE family transcriptional regulator [Deefgea rivuli]